MEERRAAIVAFVNEKGTISFSQLKRRFPNVSEMTLRTDLKALDEEQRIVRVHGGAKSVNVIIGTDDLYSTRSVRNIESKQVIAEKAKSLIHSNTTLFLDSGSTTTMLAKSLEDKPHIIYTTGLSCATELMHLTQSQVYIPSGEINRFSMSVCGIRGIQELQQTNFDMTFLGVTSFSSDFYFSCGAQDEALLKRTALTSAEKKVVLMDSSKIDMKSTFNICHLEEIDILISDNELSDDVKKLCEQYHVEVL